MGWFQFCQASGQLQSMQSLILYGLHASNKVLFNKRRHRVSSSHACPLPVQFLSKENMIWPMEKWTISLLFFSLLLGKNFGSGRRISLCVMLLHHVVFPAKTWREEVLVLQLQGRFSWSSEVEQNKRAGSCCLGSLLLPSGERALSLSSSLFLFGVHKSILSI